MHKWLGRFDIADPEHINDLEVQSAIGEFQHKMPRHKAEEEAYKSYTKDRVLESAAHHLTGMRMAHAAGNIDAAAQHGMHYKIALKKLGHPEIGEVPHEILNKLKHNDDKSPYKFKGHGSDQFLGTNLDKSEIIKELKDKLIKRILDKKKAIK